MQTIPGVYSTACIDDHCAALLDSGKVRKYTSFFSPETCGERGLQGGLQMMGGYWDQGLGLKADRKTTSIYLRDRCPRQVAGVFSFEL